MWINSKIGHLRSLHTAKFLSLFIVMIRKLSRIFFPKEGFFLIKSVKWQNNLCAKLPDAVSILINNHTCYTCRFSNMHINKVFSSIVHPLSSIFYLFDDRSATAHSDVLGCCRTLQFVVVREAVVFPRSADSLPKSQVHASGQQ